MDMTDEESEEQNQEEGATSGFFFKTVLQPTTRSTILLLEGTNNPPCLVHALGSKLRLLPGAREAFIGSNILSAAVVRRADMAGGGGGGGGGGDSTSTLLVALLNGGKNIALLDVCPSGTSNEWDHGVRIRCCCYVPPSFEREFAESASERDGEYDGHADKVVNSVVLDAFQDERGRVSVAFAVLSGKKIVIMPSMAVESDDSDTVDNMPDSAQIYSVDEPVAGLQLIDGDGLILEAFDTGKAMLRRVSPGRGLDMQILAQLDSTNHYEEEFRGCLTTSGVRFLPWVQHTVESDENGGRIVGLMFLPGGAPPLESGDRDPRICAVTLKNVASLENDEGGQGLQVLQPRTCKNESAFHTQVIDFPDQVVTIMRGASIHAWSVNGAGNFTLALNSGLLLHLKLACDESGMLRCEQPCHGQHHHHGSYPCMLTRLSSLVSSLAALGDDEAAVWTYDGVFQLIRFDGEKTAELLNEDASRVRLSNDARGIGPILDMAILDRSPRQRVVVASGECTTSFGGGSKQGKENPVGSISIVTNGFRAENATDSTTFGAATGWGLQHPNGDGLADSDSRSDGPVISKLFSIHLTGNESEMPSFLVVSGVGGTRALDILSTQPVERHSQCETTLVDITASTGLRNEVPTIASGRLSENMVAQVMLDEVRLLSITEECRSEKVLHGSSSWFPEPLDGNIGCAAVGGGLIVVGFAQSRCLKVLRQENKRYPESLRAIPMAELDEVSITLQRECSCLNILPIVGKVYIVIGTYDGRISFYRYDTNSSDLNVVLNVCVAELIHSVTKATNLADTIAESVLLKSEGRSSRGVQQQQSLAEDSEIVNLFVGTRGGGLLSLGLSCEDNGILVPDIASYQYCELGMAPVSLTHLWNGASLSVSDQPWLVGNLSQMLDSAGETKFSFCPVCITGSKRGAITNAAPLQYPSVAVIESGSLRIITMSTERWTISSLKLSGQPRILLTNHSSEAKRTFLVGSQKHLGSRDCILNISVSDCSEQHIIGELALQDNERILSMSYWDVSCKSNSAGLATMSNSNRYVAVGTSLPDGGGANSGESRVQNDSRIGKLHLLRVSDSGKLIRVAYVRFPAPVYALNQIRCTDGGFGTELMLASCGARIVVLTLEQVSADLQPCETSIRVVRIAGVSPRGVVSSIASRGCTFAAADQKDGVVFYSFSSSEREDCQENVQNNNRRELAELGRAPSPTASSPIEGGTMLSSPLSKPYGRIVREAFAENIKRTKCLRIFGSNRVVGVGTDGSFFAMDSLRNAVRGFSPERNVTVTAFFAFLGEPGASLILGDLRHPAYSSQHQVPASDDVTEACMVVGTELGRILALLPLTASNLATLQIAQRRVLRHPLTRPLLGEAMYGRSMMHPVGVIDGDILSQLFHLPRSLQHAILAPPADFHLRPLKPDCPDAVISLLRKLLFDLA